MDDTSSITYLSFAEVTVHGGATTQSTPAKSVYLIREELSDILNVYGRMVAQGIWKDYAISSEKDHAIFAIFRRAAEQPLYKIIKEPKLAGKQGMWRIEGMSGQTLKRGRTLKTMLKYFDRLLLKAI